MRILSSIIVVLGFLFSVGCQANSVDAGNPPEAIPTQIASPLFTPQPDSQAEGPQMTPSTSVTSGLEGLIEQAKEDLAQRLNISVTQISLIKAKPVVWPDSSMGCPQPGMAYLQIPDDGALIILQVGDTSYEYHNGGNRGLFLCENTYKVPAITPNLDLFNLTPSKSDPPPTTPDNSIPPGEDT